MIPVKKLGASLESRIESLPAVSIKTGWKLILKSALDVRTQSKMTTRQIEWYCAAIKNASSALFAFYV